MKNNSNDTRVIDRGVRSSENGEDRAMFWLEKPVTQIIMITEQNYEEKITASAIQT